MLAAFDALQHFKGAIVAESDLIDALKLIGDAEALADELESDAGAASGRFPSAEEEELIAIDAGNCGDGFSEDGGGRVRVGETALGRVDGNELEGNFLRNGHHDLLKLGLGSERDEPDFAAGRFGGEVGSFVECAGGPWVEDGGEQHFVFEGRAGSGFQGLQRVRRNPRADYDV